MQILHAAASGALLVLWGEAPEGPSAAGPRRRGRRPKASRPPAIRFDAGHARLCAALAEGLPGLDVVPETWVAWLPSGDQGALPSSPLVAESAEGETEGASRTPPGR